MTLSVPSILMTNSPLPVRTKLFFNNYSKFLENLEEMYSMYSRHVDILTLSVALPPFDAHINHMKTSTEGIFFQCFLVVLKHLLQND